MTDEQMRAGPEMDAAVAEAIGVEGWIESLRHEGTGYESPPRFVRAGEDGFWEPSSNMDAALNAAGRFGLWDRHTFGRDNVYCVWEVDGPNEAIFAVATGETGPLAICRAILKLAGHTPPYGTWCRDRAACAGKGYCPLDPTCGD